MRHCASPPFHFSTIFPLRNLASLIKSARTLRRIHRPLLAESSTIALACVHGFKLCLLARRYEVSMFLEVLDDLFADHFPLKAAQRTLDRFVVVYNYKSHLSSHLLSAKVLCPVWAPPAGGQTIIRTILQSKGKPTARIHAQPFERPRGASARPVISL